MPPRTSVRSALPGVVLTCLLLVLAACGQGGQATTVAEATEAGPSRGAGDPEAGPSVGAGVESAPGDVVLRVERTGGFRTPLDVAATLPLVSVYGDGRVLTLVGEGLPSGAAPPLRLQQLEPSGVETLVGLARQAGLGEEPDVGDVPVADAPTTRFTVRTGESTDVLDVDALGDEAGPGPGGAGTGLTEPQTQARVRLAQLLEGLQDLPDLLGAAAVADLGAYPATRVAVLSTPFAGEVPTDPATGQASWPGPDLPGQPLEPRLDLSCLLVEGDALAGVLAAAAEVGPMTPWSSAGQTWLLRLRPLLPEESGCEALVDG